MHQWPNHSEESGDQFATTALPFTRIHWQRGPIGDEFNGATPEGVIRAVIARLGELDRSLPCIENTRACVALNEALAALDARTRDRYHRGVMGTSTA